MDVIFEISEKSYFTIEIGFFDTVLEMKEKIQKYHQIPIPKQTLIFNGKTMIDDRDTEFYGILDGSLIRLQVQSPPPPPPSSSSEGQNQSTIKPAKIHEESSSSSSTTKIQVIIKVPISKSRFSIEMDINDSISKLKEKINEIETSISNTHFILVFSGTELIELNRTLNEYGILNLSEVNVILKSFPSSSPSPSLSSGGGGGGVSSNSSGSNKRMRVMVNIKYGSKTIQVQVNPMANVGDIRKELEKNAQLNLPNEGYFFIHKQNVMEENRSFRWHEVRQGDIVEIFNGSVTGGS